MGGANVGQAQSPARLPPVALLHQHRVPLNVHREGLHIFLGWSSSYFSSHTVESCTVPRAFDRAVGQDLTSRERHALVRALIVQRRDLLAAPDEAHLFAGGSVTDRVPPSGMLRIEKTVEQRQGTGFWVQASGKHEAF